MTVTFIIFACKANGQKFECFRWCRDAESGIARAYKDASEHGVEIVHAWAEAV